MGKTAREKRSAGPPPSGAGDSVDRRVSPPGAGAAAAEQPAEPLERARLQAEVAKQRVRIAKEELKRARRRMKEAKREAKRARKQAAATRKAWKKARKAHRTTPSPTAPSASRSPRRRPSRGARSRRAAAGA